MKMTSARVKPASPAKFLLLQFFLCLVIRLSGSASVNIPREGNVNVHIGNDDDALLESLASSKILMDRTTPASPSFTPDLMTHLGLKSSTAATVTGSEEKIIIGATPPGNKEVEDGNNSPGMLISPLHVAQCRATCIEKLTATTPAAGGSTPTSVIKITTEALGAVDADIHGDTLPQPQLPSSPKTVGDDEQPAEEIHLLPKLLRLSRKKRAPATTRSCSNSPECLSMAGCQVACSFYDRLFTSSSNGKFPASGKGTDPVVATRQESLLQIVPGRLTWPGKEVDGAAGIGMKMTPVVYMVIQEYPDRKWRQIAQTTEEEFSIPKELTTGMKTKLRSIRVLVVGPEGLLSVYTSNSNNPRLEKSAGKDKTKQQQKFVYKSNNSGKVVVVEKEQEQEPPPSFEGKNDKENGSESDVDGYVAPEHTTIVFGREGEKSSTSTPQLQFQFESDYITEAPRHNNVIDNRVETQTDTVDVGVTEQPFELRVVSLIHQKSLVIAELSWNLIGGNPSQEYLITWELTGGGLKGHLVTDSTSVTLSLWPDTTYKIQVELFEQNLDADGEQEQPVESSATSLKSLPLIVDTTEASFPTGSSSALRQKTGEEEDDHYSYDNDGGEHSSDSNEDEFISQPPREQNGNESEEEEKPTHKSFMNLSNNLGFVLCLATISTMLVLILLTLAAYGWTRFKLTSSKTSSSSKLGLKKVVCCFPGKGVGCCDRNSSLGSSFCGNFPYCFTRSEKEPQLLSSQEDLSSVETETFSPFYYAVELKKSQRRKSNKTKMLLQWPFRSHQQDKVVAGQAVEAPVAVISSSSSLSSGGRTGLGPAPASAPSHYYAYEDGLLLPSFLATTDTSSSSRVAGVPGEGLSEQGCTSSSSCSLPGTNFDATNNAAEATSTSSPVTTT